MNATFDPRITYVMVPRNDPFDAIAQVKINGRFAAVIYPFSSTNHERRIQNRVAVCFLAANDEFMTADVSPSNLQVFMQTLALATPPFPAS